MNKNQQDSSDYRYSHQAPDYGENYDKSFFEENYKKLIYRWEKSVLIDFLEDRKINKYIDFACGTARMTRIFEDYVENSSGLDISESMLNVARENCKKTNFIHGDLTRDSNLIDRDYDMISTFRFFTNAQESLRKEVIDELAPRIKPGGYLIFNIHMNSNSPFALMARVYEKIFGKREGFNHISLSGMKERHLNRHGLKVERLITKGVIPVIREGKVYPSWVLTSINGIEKIMSIIPGYKYVSKYQIVICKKALK